MYEVLKNRTYLGKELFLIFWAPIFSCQKQLLKWKTVCIKARMLLSTLSVIKHFICGNNKNWLLNLHLIYETVWAGARSSLLISLLEKLNWIHLMVLTTLVLLMSKWMALALRKNHLLRCCGWIFLQNWIEALKLPPRKLDP